MTDRPTYGADAPPIADAGLGGLLSRLLTETRALAVAEIDVQKAKVGGRIASYRTAAIFFAIAGSLGFAALIALLVGLVMTLAPIVGPGAATAIVVVVVLVIAGIMAAIGKAKLAHRAPLEKIS